MGRESTADVPHLAAGTVVQLAIPGLPYARLIAHEGDRLVVELTGVRVRVLPSRMAPDASPGTWHVEVVDVLRVPPESETPPRRRRASAKGVR